MRYWHLILLLWIHVACFQTMGELPGSAVVSLQSLPTCALACCSARLLTVCRPPSHIFPGPRDAPLVGLLAEHLWPHLLWGGCLPESFIQQLLIENVLNKLADTAWVPGDVSMK